MGYSTYFDGGFELNRKLTVSELATLSSFSEWGAEMPEGPRQRYAERPPSECQWVISEAEDGHVLSHNCDEKFYNWVAWLGYLCKLFTEWEVTMTGRAVWQGEDTGDTGMIFIKENQLKLVSIWDMPEPVW